MNFAEWLAQQIRVPQNPRAGTCHKIRAQEEAPVRTLHRGVAHETGTVREPWNTPLLSVRDVFVLTCWFIQLLAYRAIVDPGGGLSRSTRGALPIAAAAMLR
ncbi:hypothetical protein [Pseudarthrobacter cellobiosi]|uniref:hypothetical protein n=1 Tax=Pseudarthrobacter cellobiosi TaxID=2953654 RepID=UPI00208E9D28|nr:MULTISPECIES: hypothetical protein [unclassified Pseudarthrobacter]MCO4274385.1 hypothetical protein [Pseudarthrobacter sp. HLT3-5]